jgi:hypothetical protein
LQGGDFEDIAVLSNVKFTITAARRIMASKTLLPDVEQEMVIIPLFTWTEIIYMDGNSLD